MKRYVFKDWVVMTLGIINLFLIMLMASECEDVFTLFITNVVALIIFLFNSILILRFGKKELF